jgi:uncharacterized protein (DUF488 family)
LLIIAGTQIDPGALMQGKTIYTIGHSTHSIGKFIDMLSSFRVGLLADIRAFAASRRYPHFNSEPLARSLMAAGIEYLHFPGLGGRRKPLPDSPNKAWRVEGFRGYADYMASPAFAEAAAALEEMAQVKITCYMCSEAVWWSCHRSLLSDHYKSRGWTVLHILGENKADEHPYTEPARIVNGILTYVPADLFNG